MARDKFTAFISNTYPYSIKKMAANCWLISGQIITKEKPLEDGRKLLTITGEPCLYKKEEKPLIAAEKTAIYEVKGDTDLAEIIQYLNEHPEDKKFILKLLKGKKEIKEALEGFKIKALLGGEG